MGKRRGGAMRRWIERFGRDARGAIAPLAAVVISTMLLGTFASVDIARLVTARGQLQDAVDSAALALARMPTTTTDAAMQAKAKAWIVANVTDPDIQNLVVGTPVRTVAGQIQVNISASIATTTSSLMGINALQFQAHSTVKYGTTHVELVFVLDNTGSMNDDNKIGSLKSAATTLIDTLNLSALASGDPNALKVGFVPFSMAVNVGTAYQGANWMTGAMPAAYGANADAVDPSHPDRFALLKNMKLSWGGCVEDRAMPYDVQETPPDPNNGATMFVPYFAPDEPDDGWYQTHGVAPYNYGSLQGGNSNNWSKSSTYNGTNFQLYSENNYLADNVNDSYNNKSVGGNWNQHQYATGWKYYGAIATGNSVVWGNPIGPNAGCTVQPLQRLTTNISSVETQINNMVAGGDTEIPLGLVWGWHLISPNAPFADGTAYGTAGTIKVIVLVTDGANTYGTSSNINQSHYTALGYAANQRITSATDANSVQSALDSRLQTLCGNMKARNADNTWKINIYTVPLEVTDTNIKSLLQGCVTDPANYLDTASSTQLAATFQNIAGSISALRVAH